MHIVWQINHISQIINDYCLFICWGQFLIYLQTSYYLQKLEIMNEEIHMFNKIFKQLDINAISSEYLSSMEGQIHQLENNFDKTLHQTRLKMLKVLHSCKQKITQQQLKQIKNKLALLNSQKKHVIEEGFIHLYIDIYDEKKKAKKIGDFQIGEITSMLLNCLQGLTRYFYLQHQLKQFRKYKNLLKQNICSNFQGQHQAMQQKIKQRVASKKCSQIFKQYLKEQQANKNKQVCRICYKKIDISQLVNHVDYCGKKTYIKSQLQENFQKRMELVGRFEQLTSDLVERNDLKTLEIVQNIANFYRNLRKQDRKSKRNSVRYQDTNCPLFFYQHQIYLKDQVKLVNQVSILEDKAFCLSKKLQQIQNHLTQVNGDNTNILKHSLNLNLKLKKYQTISRQLAKNTPKRSTISQSSQNSFSSSNSKQRPHKFSNSNSLSVSNQKSTSKQSHLSPMPQSPQPSMQPPVIVHRRLKKKLTDCQRYSIGTKSDSNASQTNYCSMSIKNFQILKILGKGAFGRVYLVRRNKTKDIYALKAIKIEKNWGEHQLQLIKNQYGVYKKIAGDHLVAATFSFQEKNVQFFVLQYMPGGDLSTFLEENVYLNESDASFYLAQILLAIQHLHSSQIIHRDLKPQNIVLDQKGHIKLTDFGLSQLRVQNKIMKARDNKIPQQKSPQSPCSPCSPCPPSNMLKSSKKSVIRNKNDKKLIGTPDYIAPQIIQGKSLANPTIDWWSFGVIAYEMMVGCRPFSARTVEEIFSNICKGEIQWPQIGDKQDQMSRVAADFVGGLLKKNFQERLGFKGVEQIKNHQFFKNIDWQNLKNTTPPLKSPSTTSQKLELASQNKQLRKQLQSLIDSSPQSQSPQVKQPHLNKLQQLRNYVRYDLLTAQTLQSVRRGTIKKQKRIRKLQSIASNFQNLEPWESMCKNAMSSGDEDQGERDGTLKK